MRALAPLVRTSCPMGGMCVPGEECAEMEEHLIATFKKGQYERGCCQNTSGKALRVTRSAVGPHWVYMCIPKGVPRRLA